jgi:hypothetical protein
MFTLKPETIKQKKGANILQLDLKLDEESKQECLHSRRRNSNSSIIKKKPRKLSSNLPNPKLSIDGLFSTRYFTPSVISEL